MKIITDSVGSNFTYSDYSNVSEVISDLKKNDIDYAIVPRYYALKEIVTNNIYSKHSICTKRNCKPRKYNKITTRNIRD